MRHTTPTGRILPHEPKGQNIPMPETDEGRRLKALIREVFGVPAPEKRVFTMDYDDLERRFLAAWTRRGAL